MRALVLAAALSGCVGPFSPLPSATPPSRTGLLRAAPVEIARLDGVVIVDGGLSGLDVRDGAWWAVADRGPNLEAEARVGRPAKRFALPDYAPPLVRLGVVRGTLTVDERRPIRRPDGTPVTGRPPAADGAETETPLGPDDAVLALDAWGIDAEGLAFAGRDLWVTDEYRPSLWRLDAATGRVLERWTPAPSHPVDRALPPVVAGRQPNLGFEGVAISDGRVVASLQGPIVTATADPATPFVRILSLDPESGTAETFAYPMAGPQRKVGDLAALGDRVLLVLEHGLDAGGTWSGQVYAVRLEPADALGDAEPERHATVGAARADGVPVLDKALVLDLVPSGWPADLHKPEGLAVVDGTHLVVLSDNDYGVDAPAADGRPVATGQPTTLAVFRVPALQAISSARR